MNNLGKKRKSRGARGFARQLRHRGKTRKVKGTIKERRGRFNDVPSIHERPLLAENRTRFGHWEGDTVRGKTGRSALVALVDRKSRYLLAERVSKVAAKPVVQAMMDLLNSVTLERVKTLTPDRGTEFANYQDVIDTLEIPVFFPDPHAPQQRGTNENINGLIREYFPKGTDLNDLNDQEIIAFVTDLNNRPRKVLGWKSPSEVFFGKKLRLI
ncbi:transposase [Lactiplantibacillus plantarum]|nr:transposase [Lactiplantibacillus plantarum]